MKRIRKIRKRTIAIVVLVVLVFVGLENYAQTYVTHLSVTSTENLAQYLTFAFNGTRPFHQDFSSSSVDWLVGWNYMKPQLGQNVFFIFIFKTSSSGNLLLQDLDIAPSRIEIASHGLSHENALAATVGQVTYFTDFVTVRIDYNIPASDAYQVSLTLVSNAYAKTILGYFPIGETPFPINVNMTTAT